MCQFSSTRISWSYIYTTHVTLGTRYVSPYLEGVLDHVDQDRKRRVLLLVGFVDNLEEVEGYDTSVQAALLLLEGADLSQI